MLSDYQAILLDLDGTIYHKDQALPGAADLVGRLVRDQRLFACLSNTTHGPPRAAALLATMGIAIDAGRIYTATRAAADHVLQAFSPCPRIFNLGPEDVYELLAGQADWTGGPTDACDAIIVGTPTNTHASPERQRIAVELARRGALVVGTSADRVFPSPRGMELGSGALTTMIAYAAGVQPVFCGKPQRVFFEHLCQRLGVEPARCLLIGDNIESDIAGGKAMGMATILTLTGVTQAADVGSLPAALRPDHVIRDLRELV